jgi:hypothetical protein
MAAKRSIRSLLFLGLALSVLLTAEAAAAQNKKPAPCLDTSATSQAAMNECAGGSGIGPKRASRSF